MSDQDNQIKCKIPTRSYILTDDEDNELLCASFVDLYYLCGVVAGDLPEGITDRERFKKIAEAINEEFNSEITWQQAMVVTMDMEKNGIELKKNPFFNYLG